MTLWAKCNQASQGSSIFWEFVGVNIRYFNLNLDHDTFFVNNAQSTMMQPGKLNAMNVHINENTSDKDLVAAFVIRRWNGSGWGGVEAFNLFTIPAGQTGYFCSSLSEDQTDTAWQARDIIGVRLIRTSPVTGNIKSITIGLAWQSDELTLTDTSGTNRSPA